MRTFNKIAGPFHKNEKAGGGTPALVTQLD